MRGEGEERGERGFICASLEFEGGVGEAGPKDF